MKQHPYKIGDYVLGRYDDAAYPDSRPMVWVALVVKSQRPGWMRVRADGQKRIWGRDVWDSWGMADGGVGWYEAEDAVRKLLPEEIVVLKLTGEFHDLTKRAVKRKAAKPRRSR